MAIKQTILRVLDSVVHPETGRGLAESGFVSEISGDGEKHIEVALGFGRAREPFAASLRRKASDALKAAFPDVPHISVETMRADGENAGNSEPKKRPGSKSSPERPDGIKRIVAIASGKGGVGKSTVAAHLAATLAAEGYRVGVLDADIYGPSQPALFGVENYLPPAERDGADALITPAERKGVKIMSIGFFISPADALVWRGPMATNALRQLIGQTAWGELDYLLVDLPPGTGDIHLSLAGELKLDGAVIVSTPQSLALADVKRGVEMFRSEGIAVPLLGIVENMAWFTPAELPDNKYYIFGKSGARKFAETEQMEFLGDIPIVQSVMESGEKGLPAQGIHPEVAAYYSVIAKKIVDKFEK